MDVIAGMCLGLLAACPGLAILAFTAWRVLR